MATPGQQPSADQLSASLKMMRIMTVAFVAACSMFVYIAENVLQPASHTPDPLIFKVFASIAIAAGAVALFLRVKRIPASLNRLAAGEAAAWGAWRGSHMLGLALSESVVLFGFVLRQLGATRDQVLPFYVGGFLLLALFFPRRPDFADTGMYQ
jgi:hypothetical protein